MIEAEADALVTSIFNETNPGSAALTHWHMLCSSDAALRMMIPNLMQQSEDGPRIHSQVGTLNTLNACQGFYYNATSIVPSSGRLHPLLGAGFEENHQLLILLG